MPRGHRQGQVALGAACLLSPASESFTLDKC
jgi:hypothetical protein